MNARFVQRKSGLASFLRIVKKWESRVRAGWAARDGVSAQVLTASRVTFENLQHDFPQRVIYWRNGKRLCARVEGTINGKVEAEEYCWQRMKN